ncbi:MAG: Rrf2 family transcriptional regulator [Sedimenticola sp.]|nr:Rrf2 family transcriptional regulator [Sedimenticola sp.]
MRLTTFSDYTVRVLIYLALDPGRRATIGELADIYQISRNHLMKVVHHLGRTGYVETVRGKGGGFLLAVPAKEINIGRLIRDTEERVSLVACFGDDSNECRIHSACEMKGMLHEALEAFYQVLEKYTLDDLLRDRERLAELLASQTGGGPIT